MREQITLNKKEWKKRNRMGILVGLLALHACISLLYQVYMRYVYVFNFRKVVVCLPLLLQISFTPHPQKKFYMGSFGRIFLGGKKKASFIILTHLYKDLY